MAKDTSFKAYNLERRGRLHTLPTPPAKITRHRMDRHVWARAVSEASSTGDGGVKGGRERKRKGRKAGKGKAPRSAADVVRCRSQEAMCLHCGRYSDDPDVSTAIFLSSCTATILISLGKWNSAVPNATPRSARPTSSPAAAALRSAGQGRKGTAPSLRPAFTYPRANG